MRPIEPRTLFELFSTAGSVQPLENVSNVLLPSRGETLHHRVKPFSRQSQNRRKWKRLNAKQSRKDARRVDLINLGFY